MNNSFDSENQNRDRIAHQSRGEISLHIERLVLDGFGYSLYERGELRNALQRQLTALIARLVSGICSKEGWFRRCVPKESKFVPRADPPR
jgi:hypothetical protein